MNRLLLPERLLGSGMNAMTSGSSRASAAIATVVWCWFHMWITASGGQIISGTTPVYDICMARWRLLP